MTTELEKQLRHAYAQLPDEHADSSDLVARSRHKATALRRRRTAGACAGTVAAALAVGAVAGIGPGIGASEDSIQLAPAAGPTRSATAQRSVHASPKPTASTSRTAEKQPYPDEGTDKPLAGLSGKLLPHGSQLPAGLTYHGMSTKDYNQTWSTSKADGYANPVPLVIMTGAEQRLDGPSNAHVNHAYGMVSSADDAFDTPKLGDRDPKFRSVNASIVRFRSAADANAALAKTQRKEDGLYWVMTKLTKPNVQWSGVPGANGDHGVYDLRTAGPNPGFVAYQIVGAYIVSASSEKAAPAEQAVTDMVGNLRTAGLLK